MRTPSTTVAQRRLKGRSTRLLLPAALASLPVGFGAGYYGLQTLAFPEAAMRPLLALLAILLPVLSAYSLRRYNRQLATLRGIERGTREGTEAELLEVARRVYQMPDLVFRMNSVTWVVATLFVVLGLELLVPEITGSHVVRMFICGLAFFPVGSVLAYLLVARQARQILARLPRAGLSPRQMAAALPASPVGVRARLVIFTAILVLVPSAVIADLSVSVLRRGMERVQLEADPARQALIAEEAVKDALQAVALLGGAVVGFALLTAWAGGTALAEPMRALAREADRMRAGNLAEPAVIPAEDELWAVATTFAEVQGHLASGVSELRRAGLQMSTTADQLQAMAQKHVSGANEQAGALQQTSVTTEQLARVAKQIAESARGVTERAAETLTATRSGLAKTAAFKDAMERLDGDHHNISEAVTELERRALMIRGLVAFIASVADRADLLALNADLESTKAGDAGRGFSLVASEMRRLGEEVAKSTQQIQGLIEEVREATAQALRATDTGSKTTRLGVELATRVSDGLSRIVSFASDTTQSARAISEATNQQQSGSLQLAEAMSAVLQVTQDQQRGTDTLQASTVDLAELARELKSVVERFKVPS